jgi:polysaccharide export outer membrane protein
MRILNYLFLMLSISCATVFCGQPVAAENAAAYVLGPEDGISVRVADLDEFDPKSLGVVHIDRQGNVHLPLVGRIQASGLTTDQLEKEVAGRLAGVMKDPEVSVSVAEFRSHPVSVLGAVRNPGVYQVTGRKTLFEVLSLAGGLSPDASNRIKISRLTSAGPLPLTNAALDATGEYYIGELNVRNVMDAKSAGENIAVLASDVVTVPKADLVYVVGAVRRSGGFPLNEKETMSVLQVVSLAEGLDTVAGANNARILRASEPGSERREITVKVKDILDGRAKDISLQANDILFIPTSVAKSASKRTLEAVIQTATGMAVFARY